MFTTNIEVEQDPHLFPEMAVIEMGDGYEWQGYWLLAHTIIASCALFQDLTNHDPAVSVKKVRAGSTAYKLLNGISLEISKLLPKGENAEPVAEKTPV